MTESDDSKKNANIQGSIQGIAGELLKRAVTLGAGAYVSAEDKVNKTLSTVQAPIHISKNVLSELVDKFVENYSMQVTAKIDFVKKSDSKNVSKSDSKSVSKDSKENENV